MLGVIVAIALAAVQVLPTMPPLSQGVRMVTPAPSPSPTPMSDAAIDAECRQYFKNAVCSEKLGVWLPGFGASYDPSNENRARRGISADSFVFHENGTVVDGPVGGTFFVYGDAGPPKGDIYADPVHRIVFFSRGCCAWRETVLARTESMPPVPVRHADLSTVRTARGIALGMTMRDVMQRYGRTAAHQIKGQPTYEMLSYTTRELYDPKKNNACGKDENFVFRNDRLIYIQLGWAC